MRNFLDESLDLTKHRAERYSSVNKTVREIEKKIGHTSQLSFSGENTNYGDSFLLVCPLSENEMFRRPHINEYYYVSS